VPLLRAAGEEEGEAGKDGGHEREVAPARPLAEQPGREAAMKSGDAAWMKIVLAAVVSLFACTNRIAVTA